MCIHNNDRKFPYSFSTDSVKIIYKTCQHNENSKIITEIMRSLCIIFIKLHNIVHGGTKDK